MGRCTRTKGAIPFFGSNTRRTLRCITLVWAFENFRPDTNILLISLWFKFRTIKGTIGNCSQIIVNVKMHLVTSNGELLIVENIVRNDSLWRQSFWERGNFKREAFYHASESTPFCTGMVFFLSLFSRNFNDQLSQNFHRPEIIIDRKVFRVYSIPLKGLGTSCIQRFTLHLHGLKILMEESFP